MTFQTLSGPLVAERHEHGVAIILPTAATVPFADAGVDVPNLREVLAAVLGPATATHSLHYVPSRKRLLVRLDDAVGRAGLEALHPDTAQLLSLHDGSALNSVTVTVKGTVRLARGPPPGGRTTLCSVLTRVSARGGCWDDPPGAVRLFQPSLFAVDRHSGGPGDRQRALVHQHVLGRRPEQARVFGYADDTNPVASCPVCPWPFLIRAFRPCSRRLARQCSPRGGDLKVSLLDDGRMRLVGMLGALRARGICVRAPALTPLTRRTGRRW